MTEELAEPLSGRELEVLDLLAEGLSNKLIAHRLNISEHTVKTHVASIFCEARRIQPHRSGIASHPARLGDAVA